jgi:hypothetical protein
MAVSATELGSFIFPTLIRNQSPIKRVRGVKPPDHEAVLSTEHKNLRYFAVLLTTDHSLRKLRGWDITSQTCTFANFVITDKHGVAEE